jgi:transposase
LFADLFGKTSNAFIEAIIGGERDPKAFLPLIKSGIKADREKILQSLEGNWRSEHLFTLKQNYEMHKIYQEHIKSCDAEIEKHLIQYGASLHEGLIESDDKKPVEQAEDLIKKRKHRGSPQFNVREYLKTLYGTDVMSIYGISDMSGLEILAETGADLSKWPTAKHFVGWLNLSPNNKRSGGKLISSKLMKKKPNAASQSFRVAANTLQRSNHWLGDFFRRMKSRGGNKYAIVATANKLATIFYLMVTKKQKFTPVSLEAYQQKQKKAKIAFYEKKLNELKAVAA